jgi:membrane protein DedA with SNARE-associated domain
MRKLIVDVMLFAAGFFYAKEEFGLMWFALLAAWLWGAVFNYLLLREQGRKP